VYNFKTYVAACKNNDKTIINLWKTFKFPKSTMLTISALNDVSISKVSLLWSKYKSRKGTVLPNMCCEKIK